MSALVPAQWLTVGVLMMATATAAISAERSPSVYTPIQLEPGKVVTDHLSNKDIPTGQGGFARDYIVQLQAGTQLAIDLTSNSFDTIVSLMASDGSTVAENDDGPDGSTNSLLFTRITKTGTYYIRIRSFGEVSTGSYKLKVTLLAPVKS